MIKVGALVVPAHEEGVIIRPALNPHFTDDRYRVWPAQRPALVIAAGYRRALGTNRGIRKLQVLLDSELGWVSEVFVNKIGG